MRRLSERAHGSQKPHQRGARAATTSGWRRRRRTRMCPSRLRCGTWLLEPCGIGSVLSGCRGDCPSKADALNHLGEEDDKAEGIVRPGVGVAAGVDARYPDAAVGGHAGQVWIAPHTDRNAVPAVCPRDDPRYRVQLLAPLSPPHQIAEDGKPDLLDPDTWAGLKPTGGRSLPPAAFSASASSVSTSRSMWMLRGGPPSCVGMWTPSPRGCVYWPSPSRYETSWAALARSLRVEWSWLIVV